MAHPYPLQSSLAYGPIRSRRLGNSLGINPLPTTYKLCSSNCVYCQYGWTTNRPAINGNMPSVTHIIEAAEAFSARMQREGAPIHSITLAGNGEPTLHPKLPEIVQALRALRDRWFPQAQVSILSDSTTVHRPRVRQALALLDARYMKLDVGDEAAFRLVNKPMGRVDWERMIEGLRTLEGVTLQSMFITGSVDNTAPAQVEAWVQTVGRIQPVAVQVYTVDRPPADSGIRTVSPERLRQIAERLTQATAVPAHVFA